MNEEKNILATRINEMRKELNLTQEELALKLGLKGKSSIANYESGKITPSDEIKLKMCEVFDCTMDYLMGSSEFKNFDTAFDGYMKTQHRMDVANAIQHKLIDLVQYKLPIQQIQDILCNSYNLDMATESLKKIIESQPLENRRNAQNVINEILNYINNCFEDRNLYSTFIHLKREQLKKEALYMAPVYGKISAGLPNWAEECLEGYLPIDPNLMGIINPEECFFLRVDGESMNKVIRNGAYALIRKQDTAEDGDIVAAIVNGDNEATLKRFKRFNEQFVSFEPVSSDNSFKPINVDLKNTNVIILGKYIGKFEMN